MGGPRRRGPRPRPAPSEDTLAPPIVKGVGAGDVRGLRTSGSRSPSVGQIWQVRHTEPEVAALAVEEPEEDGDEGGEVEPDAEHPERPAGADDRPDEQGEVLTEEAGEERERQEERRDPAEL